METKAQKIADLLKVLANDKRLLILCALIQEPQTVTELREKLPELSQSALSQHLALLRAHQILIYKKNGQHVTYSIDDPRVEEIIRMLKQHYCD